MKLSMKQIGYTLKWNVIHLFGDIRNSLFSLKLRYLKWRYGGADKIPSSAIGPVIIGGKEAEDALIRSGNIRMICEHISDFLRVPEDRRQFRIAYAHHVMGQLEDVQLDEAIRATVADSDARLRIFRMMESIEEISPNDIIVARARGETWNEFLAWLHRPIDNTGKANDPVI